MPKLSSCRINRTQVLRSIALTRQYNGIFAIATADISSPAASFNLAHVELGISAVADFDYGFLKIDAQLSPRSYILDPNCHLTGGFGLYSWFDAPHADKSLVG